MAACCSTRRAAGWRSIFLILATGLAVDWSQRPEFAALKPHVQLWRDHFVPEGHADYAQAEHPYLGPHFEFLRARARHRALGEPHPLLHLRGLP